MLNIKEQLKQAILKAYYKALPEILSDKNKKGVNQMKCKKCGMNMSKCKCGKKDKY